MGSVPIDITLLAGYRRVVDTACQWNSRDSEEFHGNLHSCVGRLKFLSPLAVLKSQGQQLALPVMQNSSGGIFVLLLIANVPSVRSNLSRS